MANMFCNFFPDRLSLCRLNVLESTEVISSILFSTFQFLCNHKCGMEIIHLKYLFLCVQGLYFVLVMCLNLGVLYQVPWFAQAFATHMKEWV